MKLSRSLISTGFLCERCQKQTSFVPIQFACALTGVSRSTIYYWMDRSWVHWLELPSGRRVICQESLTLRAPESAQTLRFPQKISTKVSEIVRNRPKVSNP